MLVGIVLGVALVSFLARGKLFASKPESPVEAAAGIPTTMSASSALSAAIATTIGGRGQPYQEVDLMGDWDGSEDNVAEHSG
jgi:hypothetical protein